MDYSNFYNVYSHVPVEKMVTRNSDTLQEKMEQEEKYTGVIHVQLKTRTPLFTPNTCGRQEEEKPKHQVQKFFSYDGKSPVIPGSTLRGVIRSIHETVTNSCLSVVDLDDKPVRRISEYYNAGILYRDEKGNITLYEAKKATVRKRIRPDLQQNESAKRFQEGTLVKCSDFYEVGKQHLTRRICLEDQLKNLTPQELRDWKTGCYFKGEPGLKKVGESQNAYVFYFPNEANKKSIKTNMRENSLEIQGLKDILKSYESLKENVRTPGYQGYQEYKERIQMFFEGDLKYFPVHYSEIAGNLYLSPACITKEAYYTSVMDILEAQGNHDTCKDFRKLCPTCTLFGMVGKEKDLGEEKNPEYKKYPNAWASSLRIQDAVLLHGLSENTFMKESVRLMELASPKNSSTEFYLQKPKAEEEEQVLSWTYDYYVSRKGNGKPKARIYTPKIAGRKFYWHHQIPNLPGKEYVEETVRNCTVTPVNENVDFVFPIYFEKITKRQLDQLIWICNISQDEENGRAKYGYKIGKGKPLGLGSTEFHVKSVKIRSLKDKEGNICYHMQDYNDKFEELEEPYQKLTYEGVGFDTDIKGAFLRMCDFTSTEGVPVTYPVSKGQSVKQATEGFKWFMYNHYKYHKDIEKQGNGKITGRTELIFQQYMPKLTKDNDMTLKVNKEDKKGENITDPHASGKVFANDNLITVEERKRLSGGRPQGNTEREKANFSKQKSQNLGKGGKANQNNNYGGKQKKDNVKKGDKKGRPNWNHP